MIAYTSSCYLLKKEEALASAVRGFFYISPPALKPCGLGTTQPKLA
jgi:hypothetical protein